MPPKIKRTKKSNSTEEEYEFDDSNDVYDDIIVLPNACDSDVSEDSDSEIESYEEVVPQVFYGEACKFYTHGQKKLEENHIYNWLDCENVITDKIENLLLLSDINKKKLNTLRLSNCLKTFFAVKLRSI